MRLVASADRPHGDEPVFLGVRFDIRARLARLRKNPGDAGLATDVRWSLACGRGRGELRWPIPIDFVQPGDLTGYGYEGSVVLASELPSIYRSPGTGGRGGGGLLARLQRRLRARLGEHFESRWAEVTIVPGLRRLAESPSPGIR